MLKPILLSQEKERREESSTDWDMRKRSTERKRKKMEDNVEAGKIELTTCSNKCVPSTTVCSVSC